MPPDHQSGTHESLMLAAQLVPLLVSRFALRSRARSVIGIAGESGSGKTHTATALADTLRQEGVHCCIFHQDDYFFLPPRTNHEARMRDLSLVGPQEVNLALLQAHLSAFRAGVASLTVPIVDYPGNCFTACELHFPEQGVLIVEGTYVLQLDGIDTGIFMDATHIDTRDRRRVRNRDIDDPMVDQVLAIEHGIIARQAPLAQILIDCHFAIRTRT